MAVEGRIINTVGANPLLVDKVLDSVFGYLRGDDLKSSRLICRKWREKCESHFRKAVRIRFPCKEFEGQHSAEAMADFLEVFPIEGEGGEDQSPFTAITFQGRVLESTLVAFFESERGSAIKDLQFEDVIICHGEEGDYEDCYDYNITELIQGNNLTSLCILDSYDGDNRAITNIIVEFSCLMACEVISLLNCIIIANDVVAPKEIFIESCVFQNAQGKDLTNVFINKFVDFTNCKIVVLECETTKSQLSLDMSDSLVHLDSANFNGIKISNRQHASWSIDSLYVAIEDFTRMNSLKIRSLEFYEWKNVDLAILPETIQHLTFYTLAKMRDLKSVTNTGDDTLPNLRSLRISFGVVSYQLRLFEKCRSLRDVDLRSLDIANIKNIPSQIRRLSLRYIGASVRDVGKEEILELDTLVLHYCTMDTLQCILQSVTPKILVIRQPCHHDKWMLNNFESVITLTENLGVNTVVTDIHADEHSVHNYVTKLIGDATCCRFDNEVFTPLTEDQFKGYFDFCSDMNDKEDDYFKYSKHNPPK